MSELETALTLPPIDCTGDCNYGPCNCSGERRVAAYTRESVEALMQKIYDTALRRGDGNVMDLVRPYLPTTCPEKPRKPRFVNPPCS